MVIRKGNALHRLLLICASLLWMLNACGSEIGNVTPTLAVDAIYTEAYQTLSAQATAQFALIPPTYTPSPPPSTGAPTAFSVSTHSPGSQSVCDNAAYISDLTIPDGTAITAGAKFTKTWILQNNGSCAWSNSYKLSFDSGDQMGGSDVILASPVQAGQQVEISVNLVAPMAAGAYKGFWRMHNDKGQAFGDFPYVDISVGGASTSGCRKSPRDQITIAGHAGPENTTIDYGGGSTVTDSKGNYSFTVPYGWSGTVTPSKAKVHPWTFDPAHRTYSNVTCDLIHENFVATAPPGT